MPTASASAAGPVLPVQDGMLPPVLLYSDPSLLTEDSEYNDSLVIDNSSLQVLVPAA